MKIWTQAYRPFLLGGNVNAPVWCDLEPSAGPFDLGAGYQGVMLVSPSGKTFVAEIITGGIVGKTIDEVRKDVASADADVMSAQIRNGIRDAERADRVMPDEFWRLLRA